MSEAAAPAVLELRGITKVFPGTVANDNIDLDLRRSEVHALLGENGAGKTTLMNILYGLSKPDEGEIFLNGKRVTFSSPKDAIERGIGMVHQHFMLIPVMSVAENIVLGIEPSDRGFLDYDAARTRVRALAQTFGFQIDPDALIEDISVGQQQRVEILKALYRNAAILILDEPTAVLTPQEATEFFGILQTLKREGISIIFISHKLNEVLEIADRVTVLRRGKKIETLPREGATQESLARAMVGREVVLRVDKAAAEPGDVLLEVKGLQVLDDREIEKVSGVSLTVRAGEIVGLAGVDGNGQSELIDAITGLRKIEHGKVIVAGKELRHATARDVLDAGVGQVPEDRQRRGLVLEFSIAENIALHDFRKEPNARAGWLFPKRLIEKARKLIREFDVRGGGGPETPAGALSGGNQQKVILAREIDRDPKVLIAAQPTRGLDVGAIEFVHRRLIEERDDGRAILLVSLELDEILSLSDRILVIFEGRIVGEYAPAVGEEELGFAMTGGKKRSGRVTTDVQQLPPEPVGEPEPGSLVSRYRLLQKAEGLIAPLLTLLLAFLISGVVVLLTTGSIRDTLKTYQAIFRGAGLNWFFQVGHYSIGVPFSDARVWFPWNTDDLLSASASNLEQTLLLWTALVLTGLAVAFAFRCGMFNIGGNGQYLAGSIAAVLIATELPGVVNLPGPLLIIVSIIGAMLAGAALAGIAGLLKGTVGAHEVITTIMLNWIVVWVGSYLFDVGGPLQTNAAGAAGAVPSSQDVPDKAHLHTFWGDPLLQGLHIGFFIAIASLVVYSLVLNRTTLGYEVRAVGHNPEAARYGGINVPKNYFFAMAIAGLFAGLAGSLDVLGWQYRVDITTIQGANIGFIGIAVALLGRNTAVGVGLAALLFAALQTGTASRNLDPTIFAPGVGGSLAVIIQGLVVLFVGADLLILILLGWLRHGRRKRRAPA